MDLRRLGILAVMALVLGATLSWLQSRFDQSDLRHARELLDQTRPSPASPSIEQALAKRLGHPVSCGAAITSGCRGIVQLRCAGGGEGDYLFDADLAQRPPVLHPANPNAQSLMLDLARAAGLKLGDAPIPVVKPDAGR